MDKKLVEKVAEKLYKQRWYKGMPTWENSELKQLFYNYAQQIIPLIAEEIKGELEKLLFKYPEWTLSIGMSRLEWAAFWERYGG